MKPYRKENRYFKHIRICAGLLFVMIFTMALSGCSTDGLLGSGENRTPKNIKIGISIYDEYDTFISNTVQDINEWSKEKENEESITISLEITSANGSQLTQNDQIEKFIDKKCDVICVNLVDRTDATVIIDKAKSADIPVIFFNRELVEEDLERWDKLYYVGAIAEQSGKMQARIVTDALGDTGRFNEIDINDDGTIQYVMLEGETGHQDALVRTQVSIEEIKNAGFSVEKLGDEIANWNRAQAATKMKSLIEKYPWQIEMIIANDDDMALGAIDALEAAGVEHFPLIVGVNGTKDALEMIKTKKMEGTVYNDADGQAETIMSMAYGLAVDGKIPEDIKLDEDKYKYLPYRIINYNNVQSYIRKNTQ